MRIVAYIMQKVGGQTDAVECMERLIIVPTSPCTACLPFLSSPSLSFIKGATVNIIAYRMIAMMGKGRISRLDCCSGKSQR